MLVCARHRGVLYILIFDAEVVAQSKFRNPSINKRACSKLGLKIGNLSYIS